MFLLYLYINCTCCLQSIFEEPAPSLHGNVSGNLEKPARLSMLSMAGCDLHERGRRFDQRQPLQEHPPAVRGSSAADARRAGRRVRGERWRTRGLTRGRIVHCAFASGRSLAVVVVFPFQYVGLPLWPRKLGRRKPSFLIIGDVHRVCLVSLQWVRPVRKNRPIPVKNEGVPQLKTGTTNTKMHIVFRAVADCSSTIVGLHFYCRFEHGSAVRVSMYNTTEPPYLVEIGTPASFCTSWRNGPKVTRRRGWKSSPGMGAHVDTYAW